MSEEVKSAQDLTNQLWSMANDLRGNMDASEFRNYILGFMFYRYLSEHQEDYIINEDLVEISGDETVNEAYIRAAAEDGEEDYLEDIASSLGYAIAPNDTWASIIDRVNSDKILPEDFQNMFDNFDKNAQINTNASGDFTNIFADVNLSDNKLGNSTTSRARALKNIVLSVDEFNYLGENGKDILGDVYEYLIAKFAGNSGKKAGEFYTPHEVSQVLSKLVTINESTVDRPFSVYDPTMGSGSLLLTVQDELPDGNTQGAVQFYGQELNTTTFNLARMNLMMHGVEYQNMTLNNGDTLESDWPDGPDDQGIDHPRSFDAVVANPPYSAHWDNNDNKLKDPRFKDYGLAPGTKADFAFLLHGLYHLKSTGTMAIVLPHGVLFRGAKEGKIRQALLEKNQIDAVIGLPAGLFFSTSIPTVVLVLKRQRDNRDVMFIDASEHFEKGKNQNVLRSEDIELIINTYKDRKDVDKLAHVASLEEIQENDYNLNIPRYVDTFEEEPEIDLDKLTTQMKETQTQIKQNETELISMLNELKSDDPKIKSDLQHFIQALGGDSNE
ncbi:type I restriction-modification system subunit M [Lactobacillus terrae]|uniref:type I restriction-modification system subunit M n=1 Tax=Lactobacillus terrae TaxID=2269374 RepID=UPI000C1B66FC|nr:type I restriction-modification system subunit M [Lactobacillus terrae]